MRLAQLFLQQGTRAANAAHASTEELERALCKMVEVGRARWPQIPLSTEDFVQFLAMQLPAESADPAELLSLRAGELYLVRALGLGHPAALVAFETDYMPEVRRTLLRLGTPEPLIEDVIQTLYSQLIERQNTPQGVEVSRQGYAGRGELKGWLCTCAVHQAGRLQQRDRREVELLQAPAVLLADQGKGPELALLTGEVKELFEAAFREAVAALTSRERNLLRYHFLSGLSIDQIGSIYRVHRATAARWVVQAREHLATQTRKRFQAAASMHDKSFSEILELVHSQLSLNLASLLKSANLDSSLPNGLAGKE